MTPAQKKILVVAIIVVFAVLLIGLWNSFYDTRKVLSPKPAEEGESRISQKELQLSPEVLKALWGGGGGGGVGGGVWGPAMWRGLRGRWAG
jgi:hypothetical protein